MNARSGTDRLRFKAEGGGRGEGEGYDVIRSRICILHACSARYT